jgi:hypothetical protein
MTRNFFKINLYDEVFESLVLYAEVFPHIRLGTKFLFLVTVLSTELFNFNDFAKLPGYVTTEG